MIISHVLILMCMQLQLLLYFCGATGDCFLYNRTILTWMHGNVKFISDVVNKIFYLIVCFDLSCPILGINLILREHNNFYKIIYYSGFAAAIVVIRA